MRVCGEQCATMAGTKMLPMWFVVSLATDELSLQVAVLDLVQGLVRFSWIKCNVMEMNHPCPSVATWAGQLTTVLIGMMQGSLAPMVGIFSVILST